MKLKNNVYLTALFYTMISGASLHLLLLAFYALTSGKWEMLNAFDILDLELFVPNLGKGTEYFAASWLFIGVVYVTMLVYLLKQMKRK